MRKLQYSVHQAIASQMLSRFGTQYSDIAFKPKLILFVCYVSSWQGVPHLRDIFYRMGFEDAEIVALSGAHTLGGCHADRSGFQGEWTAHPKRFTNEYFKVCRQALCVGNNFIEL